MRRLAKSFEVETRSSTTDRVHLRIRFLPKHARKHCRYADGRSKVVIIDGWDHPDFDEPLRDIAQAPVEQLSPGVSVQWVSTSIVGGREPPKSKHQNAFEEYLRTLEPTRILLDTRNCA
jgi:hypothetical protein